MRNGVLVVGIDPGLSRCGYGVVSDKIQSAGRSGATFISGGVITTPPDAPLGERLRVFANDIFGLLAEFKPDVVAIERILFRKNAKTAFGVAQAVGLIHMICYDATIPVIEYSAAEVKLAVAGHGGASKFQVQRMVQLLIDLGKLPEPPDVADAIALGLCHIAKMKGSGMVTSI